MNTLIREILETKREYYADKVKKPLLKAITSIGKGSFFTRFLVILEIIRLARKYPDPSKQTTVFNNTHIILKIIEKHNKLHKNPSRRALIDIALRVLACEVEHDGYYSFLHDWYVMELLKNEWKPERRGFPMYRYWDTKELGTDFFTETNRSWLEKRRAELLEAERIDLQKVQTKRDTGKLWYDNAEMIKL